MFWFGLVKVNQHVFNQKSTGCNANEIRVKIPVMVNDQQTC